MSLTNTLTDHIYKDILVNEYVRNLSTQASNSIKLNQIDVDLREDEDTYIVTANLPGIYISNTKVKLLNSKLSITAFEDQEQEFLGENFIQRERRTGKLERTISLPQDATNNSSKVEATLRYGVLSVFIPKVKLDEEQDVGNVSISS